MDKHGFPFIIAVKGLTKSEILTQFKIRVNNSNPVEFDEACMQVEKIAKLRITEILD
jgi:2-oxo-4-hydroxy-4-carboxy--5-ureidoimidazoline (OHCU) decarboxylase